MDGLTRLSLVTPLCGVTLYAAQPVRGSALIDESDPAATWFFFRFSLVTPLCGVTLCAALRAAACTRTGAYR